MKPWEPIGPASQEPTRDILSMWVIYHHVRDRPEPYVVRRWAVTRAGTDAPREAHGVATLELARAVIPPGLYRMDRWHGDDPSIVEVWL